MAQIRIGWAQTSITPHRPVYNGGQIYPRISKYVHDPLMAEALALDNGESRAILLSMDLMCAPDEDIMRRVRENLAALEGFSPEYLSVSVTHTHTSLQASPLLFADEALKILGAERVWLPEKPDDLLEGAELKDFLVDRMTQVAAEAWNSRKPGGISAASDYAAVSFNRRPVFGKGGDTETIMYGVCAREDFLRFEAGSDHSADMLYTWDESGALTGVAVCIPCPSQVFELHSLLSADYWHYTRKALREAFGNIHILPLCGAAGDQTPIDLTRVSKTNRQELAIWGAQAGEVYCNYDMADICRDIADRITDAVRRGFRKAKDRVETQPAFFHKACSLRLPIRTVSEADYREAMAVIQAAQSRFSAENPIRGEDLVAIFEPMGVIWRYIQQNRSKTVDASLHYMRIGDSAWMTCPFELFIEYSLRIKARAASLHTVVVQMTDQYLDYLPTTLAIQGGSYSSAPASTTCGPESGDMLVADAIEKINALWRLNQ